MKKFLPDFIAILAFVAISFVYFFPAVIEDRIIFQHDSSAGVGAGQEAKEYHDRTGKTTRWTNSLFSGMPNYQLSPSYESTASLRMAEKVYHLFLPEYVWYTFALMLGFFLLLRVLGVSTWLSTLGGITWAFSSYFFILIDAGHIWKLITLAYIPPTVAGMLLVYRKQYLVGGLVTAFFVALQILSNHIQMSYYFFFVMLFIAGAYLEDSLKKKELPHFIKATGVLLLAGLIGIAINSSNLYHTYQYSKETMRGTKELKQPGDNNQKANGLNRDYITQWSYGIGETFTLLVPNVKGGSSTPLSESETAMEKANPMYSGLYSQLTQYFGDQPMTAGPVYVGAFVLALFLLGCFILKGPLKWALIGATLFSILLSWGKNFMGLTDFFIDYVPMYNKFRAVSSILVIAEFTIPLLAMLTLKELIEKPTLLSQKKGAFIGAFALTAGLSLLFYLAPTLFFGSYIPAQEMDALQRGIPAEQLAPIISNLQEMRIHLFTSDALRSFFIISIGFLLLFLFGRGKLKATYMLPALIILCLVDLWQVNKRYLNDSDFVPRSERTDSFTKSSTDEYILQDKSLDYRVLNLASNTFNENNTSYWHKSIGGYHAAKLQRYQDVIDHHIQSEMKNLYTEVGKAQGDMKQIDPSLFRVLNMLNTKYFIFPTGEGKTLPIENPYAYGNAWFVNEVQYVADANEEMDRLGTTNLTDIAIVDQRFREALTGREGATASPKDSLASIKLTGYEPNQLTYETQNTHESVAVFSEVYYPGWQATVDGKPVEIARANYILRAITLPAGKHTVEFRFDPKSLHLTEGVAYGGIALLIVGVMILLIKYKKRQTQL